MNPMRKQSQYLSYSPSKPHFQGNMMHGSSVSGSETDVSTSNENLSQEERYVIRHTARQEPQGQENMGYNTLIINEDQWQNRSSERGAPPRYGSQMEHCHQSGRQDSGVREITDIPDDYLRQSQVLKHLAKEVKVRSGGGGGHGGGESSGGESCSTKKSNNSGGGCHNNSSSGNNGGCGGGNSSSNSSGGQRQGSNNSSRQDSSSGGGGLSLAARRLRSKLSKSQPDLTAAQRENTMLRTTLGNTRKDQELCAQMVDHLIQENNTLKAELEACYHKVAKAQKLEEEVTKVSRAHEELVATCDRRERLETTCISRLQAEVRRLQETNQRLLCQQLTSPDLGRVQLAKREALIAQLLSQNKELVATKERQEIELAAQRATLQEQRTHIDILDTALINAQANVVRLEEECRSKAGYVERVGQLQRALSSLQLASDRREQTERKLRLQLEQELRNERAKLSNSAEAQDESESIAELKRTLREKDEKIMRLEAETTKWEQKYLEESQLRQAAIDAASIPKDAKIAALERTSQETEKLIAEARSDRIRQMDEVHAAQKKVSDLEAKVKELECKLAERDAMIRVLQKKHTLDKEVSSSYPSISLDPTLNSDLNVLASDNLGGVSTTSVFSSVSSALTSSTGFGSGASYTGSVDSYHHKYSTPTESFHHKSLDDQLKELDSQLMSKRGLCCFPGFTHPSPSQRKGKIPQPLLAGVSPGSSGQWGEELVLLEKQGLSSQATRSPGERSASLPPSSLPRPKRNSGKKLGDYGRLSDSSKESQTGSSEVRIIPLSSAGGRQSGSSGKVGEYGRLQERKCSDSESTSRGPLLPPRSYSRLDSDPSSTGSGESQTQTKDPTEIRMSPVPKYNLPPRSYSRMDSDPSSTGSHDSKQQQIEQRSSKDPTDIRMSPVPKYGLPPRSYSRMDSDPSSTGSVENKPQQKDHSTEVRMSPVPKYSLPPRSYSRMDSPSPNCSGEAKSQPLDRSVSRSPVTQKDPSEVRMSPVQKYNLPPRSYRMDSEPSSSSEMKHQQEKSGGAFPRPPAPNPPKESAVVQKFNRFFEKVGSDSGSPGSDYPSSKRSFLPPPRKISDYGCFEQETNKLRRGSLHREQHGAQQLPPKTGVRSLPTPNKYRIQF